MELSTVEVRVLGCLIEKSQATPEYYPMTMNSLTAACNQKTSRDPVVDYDERTVERAIESLRQKGLCTAVTGEGRAVKYAHRLGRNGLGLTPAQLAALSILLLRGPQTAGEIKSRSTRQHDFAGIEAVEETLESLKNLEPPLVEKGPRRPGQKEDRFRHLYFQYTAVDEAVESLAASGPAQEHTKSEWEALVERVNVLEQENQEIKVRLAAVEADMKKLKDDLY